MGVLRDPRGGESVVTVSKLVSLQIFLKSTEEPQRQELCHPPHRGQGPLPSALHDLCSWTGLLLSSLPQLTEGLPGHLVAQTGPTFLQAAAPQPGPLVLPLSPHSVPLNRPPSSPKEARKAALCGGGVASQCVEGRGAIRELSCCRTRGF